MNKGWEDFNSLFIITEKHNIVAVCFKQEQVTFNGPKIQYFLANFCNVSGVSMKISCKFHCVEPCEITNSHHLWLTNMANSNGLHFFFFCLGDITYI